MLYGALPTLPVSELRLHQAKIIETLDATPILLTQHGRGAGVLVHPRVWNDVLAVYQMALDAGLLNQRFGPVTELDETEWTIENELAPVA
ncbi:MAG: type II toxin-antitoxin system Phd/YefM family antitoxin [Chloroflexota bacterium]|nr:type II toxin-antitoxin system Phd/YefM family antitoxin [Chloroflexota bacterium]